VPGVVVVVAGGEVGEVTGLAVEAGGEVGDVTGLAVAGGGVGVGLDPVFTKSRRVEQKPAQV